MYCIKKALFGRENNINLLFVFPKCNLFSSIEVKEQRTRAEKSGAHPTELLQGLVAKTNEACDSPKSAKSLEVFTSSLL